MREWICIITLAMLLLTNGSARARTAETASQSSAHGDAKMQAGQYLDAIECYSKAIKTDKHNPDYYANRANAELSASRFRSVVADASKVIKLTPDSPRGYELRARALDQLRQYKKAQDDLNKLLSINPTSGSYLLLRAQNSINLHDAKQVLADCNRAINTGLDRTQLSSLYKMRSIAYRKLGKKVEAEQEAGKYESLK